MLAALLAISLTMPAHDSWINHGGYRNQAGDWCCGEKDCDKVDDLVNEVQGGYKLTDSGEIVPWQTVIPSQDSHYWRCHTYSNGIPKVRCFFAPLNS